MKVVNREIEARRHIAFTHPEGFDKYEKEDAYHEAAFDAVLTGKVFATVAKIGDLKGG